MGRVVVQLRPIAVRRWETGRRGRLLHGAEQDGRHQHREHPQPARPYGSTHLEAPPSGETEPPGHHSVCILFATTASGNTGDPYGPRAPPRGPRAQDSWLSTRYPYRSLKSSGSIPAAAAMAASFSGSSRSSRSSLIMYSVATRYVPLLMFTSRTRTRPVSGSLNDPNGMATM